MKITLPSGIVIETTDDVEAEWLARLMLNGTATPRPTSPVKKSHHKKKAPEPPESASLSPQLVQTWEWLVAHDNPNGVQVHAIATGLNITVHAATFRGNRLIEKGLAHRVRRGRYRPGEAEPSHQAPEPEPEPIQGPLQGPYREGEPL